MKASRVPVLIEELELQDFQIRYRELVPLSVHAQFYPDNFMPLFTFG